MSCTVVLRKKGFRFTPQRRLILDVIHETGEHLTPEELIDRVQARMPGIHRSTVYRTLELLEKTGCVYKSRLGDRFVYHHDEEGHHHHLVCVACGQRIECDEDVFAPVARLLAEKYGFQVDFRHLVMNGLCARCRGKSD
ncbi:MAG: transcriptional repressor [Dehalococcoidia bacterium]|nr:transcriptional repressor [Dehalococcoidia bacterium]